MTHFELLKYAATGIASPGMTAYDKMRAVEMASGGAVKTLTGVPPLSFKSNGMPLISWSMLGNGQQTGTPAPDAPIYPEFVGERTANLWDGIIGADNKILNETGWFNTNNLYALSEYIPVEPNTSYTYHFYHNIAENRSTYSIAEYDSNKNVIRPLTLQWITENRDYNISFTTQANTAYIRINWKKTYDEDLALNLGSTALPYEPFGYKLPIASAGQTQNVYLGEVQTTRKIKKLVLTGEENWKDASASSGYRFSIGVNGGVQSDTNVGIKSYCSHFQIVGTGMTYNTINSYAISADLAFICRINSSYTLETFKQWLSDQYVAGTPVVIWYVLATPTTGIVNEPLAKIGTYADTLDSADAGITIPTAKGANTLTVDTELQPSEMTITYR